MPTLSLPNKLKKIINLPAGSQFTEISNFKLADAPPLDLWASIYQMYLLKFWRAFSVILNVWTIRDIQFEISS